MSNSSESIKNFFYREEQDKIKELKILEKIENEKKLIFATNYMNEKLSIHQSLQLFLACAHDRTTIKNWTENDLVKYLIYSLIKIRDEARKIKSPIKIELGPYEVVDHQEFLDELKQFNFRDISTLENWYKFMDHFSDYSIHSRNIRTLMIRLGYETNITISHNTNKERATLGKKKIIDILNSLTIDEKNVASSATQGCKGLKALVKSKISHKEMYELFPNKYDFNNRWNEIRKLELK